MVIKYILALFITLLVCFQIYSQENLSSYIFCIEKIEFEGNTKSKDHVILENLNFTVGDSLSEMEIHKAIDKINNLEIFSKVTMQPKPGSVPGNLIIKLIIKVSE